MKHPKLNQNELDLMRLNPDNYKWGIFYFNPLDSRVMLPKRNNFMGLTFNFANPWTYIIFCIIIGFGILISRFS